MQGRGGAARGDPRDRLRARGGHGERASTSEHANRRAARGRGDRRGVTDAVSAPVARRYGPPMAVRDEDTDRHGPPIRCSRQTPGVEAQGRGPADGKHAEPPRLPPPGRRAGARRAASRKVLWRAREPVEGPRAVLRMNHEDRGFDCPGCAWPDDQQGPAPRHLRERHQARHLGDDAQAGRRRVLRRAHRHRAVGLERLRARGSGPARPSRCAYDAASRHVRADLVGRRLRARRRARCAGSTSPNQASFYTSGRLSNEATFLYQLWVREFGTNNLPDCSNMCHEASGRALTGVARHRQGHRATSTTGSRPT